MIDPMPTRILDPVTSYPTPTQAVDRRIERFRALLDVTRALSAEVSLDSLLQMIVMKTTEILDAERSSLYLIDRSRHEIWTKVAQLTEIREIRLSLDAPGLAPYVARTGEVVNLDDAYADSRFNPSLDRETGWRTRNMLVVPMIDHQQKIIGVVQALNKRNGSFDAEDEEILGSLAASAAVSVENAQLYSEQRAFFYSFIETMAATIDAKDRQTFGHTERVALYSIAIARSYGLSFDEVEIVRLAAILHDYGKIAISDAILAKRGKLTDDEIRAMRDHALCTKLILSKIRFPPGMETIPDVAAQHHERMDGSGGPWGNRGDEIPLGSRIIAVADVFDALTARRYYKEPMTIEDASAQIIGGAGPQFDPLVVRAFEQALPTIRTTYRQQSERIINGD